MPEMNRSDQPRADALEVADEIGRASKEWQSFRANLRGVDAQTSISPTVKAAESIEAAAVGIDAFVIALGALRDELRRAAIEFRSWPVLKGDAAE